MNVPLYSHTDLGPAIALNPRDFVPSVWQSMKLAARDAWHSNPTISMDYWAGTNPDQAQGTVWSGMDDFAAAGIAGEARAAARAPRADRAPLDWQRQRIEEAGFTGEVTPHEHYNMEALELILEQKRRERDSQIMAANAPGYHLPFSLASSFAASMADPLNLVSALIPVAGEQRMLSMLGLNAEKAWSRAAARAASGLAGGAVGAAAIEPLVYTAQQALQMDYDMASSLLNVGIGAAMGGAITPAAGAVADFVRMRRGDIMSWQFAKPTEASEKLRGQLQEEIFHARMAANPGQDMAAVRSAAAADALIFDENILHRSYMENVPPEEMYARAGFDLRNGESMRQAAARHQERAEQLWREMEELSARREMLAAFPDMRMTDADIGAARMRHEMELAKAAELRRQHKEQMDKLLAGDTLFAREQADYSAADRAESPRLIAALRDMPAMEIDSQSFAARLRESGLEGSLSRKEMKQWIDANHAEAMNVSVDGFDREMLITRKGLKETVAHGYNERIGATLPYISDIVKTSIYMGKGKRHGQLQTHLFMNKILLDGKEHVVFVVAREDANGLRFYNHEVRERINQGHRLEGADKGLPLMRDDPDSLESLLRSRLGVNEKFLTGEAIPPDNRVLFQTASGGAPGAYDDIMGATTFAKDSRALVTLFASHDHSTIMHEMSHIMRRQMRQAAQGNNANPAVTRIYARLEKDFNVEPGGIWTREQEEAFAKAFTDFIRENGARRGSLAQAFAAMRDRAIDIYARADAAGAPISAAARDVFNDMLSIPYDRGLRAFHEKLADINTRAWEREFLPPEPGRKPGDAAGLADPSIAARDMESGRQLLYDPTGDEAVSARRLQELADSQRAANDAEFARTGFGDEAMRAQVRAERDAAIAEIDGRLADMENRQKDMEDFIACYLY